MPEISSQAAPADDWAAEHAGGRGLARDASAVSRDVALPVMELRPSGRWPRLGLRELWHYRGLFYFLVWRDLKVRYADTVLGIAWAVVQPLFSAFIFTVIFGRFAKVPSDGAPYGVFSLAAMVPWVYFSTAFTSTTNSLVGNGHLITKIYFPRLIIPLTPILVGLVDYAVAFGVLLVTMIWYGIAPRPEAILLVPLLTVVMILAVAGLGSWFSALSMKYRDVKHVTPFLVQLGMYASPIVYPMSLIPERFRLLYAINPMAGVIEGFRAVLLGTVPIPWDVLGVSTLSALTLLFWGAVYFKRTERVFADLA